MHSYRRRCRNGHLARTARKCVPTQYCADDRFRYGSRTSRIADSPDVQAQVGVAIKPLIPPGLAFTFEVVYYPQLGCLLSVKLRGGGVEPPPDWQLAVSLR